MRDVDSQNLVLLLFHIYGPYVVTLLNWTSIFDWYLTMYAIKMNTEEDTCCNEINERITMLPYSLNYVLPYSRFNSQHNHDKAHAVAWSQKKVIFISPWILLAFYSKFENWNENMGDLHLLGKWYSSRFDTMVIIVRGFGSPYNGAT